MSGIKYGIHYENYSETLIAMLASLLQNQNFVDVSLVCSGKCLKVHKLVLSAISPYFYDAFKNTGGEVTIILEMNFPVLESLIEYIYLGKTCVSADLIDDLIAAARFFQIKGLSELKDLSEDVSHFSPPRIISHPIDPQSSTSEAENVNNFIFKIPIEIKKKRDLGCHSVNDEYRSNSHYYEPSQLTCDNGMEIRRRKNKKKSHHNKYGTDDMGMRLLNKATRKALHKEEKNSLETIQKIKNMHVLQSVDNQQFDLSGFSDSIAMPSNILNDIVCEQEMIQNTEQNMMDENSSTINQNAIYESTATLEQQYWNSTGGNWNLDSTNFSMSDYLNELKSKDIPASETAVLFQLEDGSVINMNEEALLNMAHNDDIQCEVVESPNMDSFVDNCMTTDSITDML